MTRLSLLLVIFLMVSAFMLVSTRFKSRQLYTSLDRLESTANQLDTDWRRLQLYRAELTRSTRIDKTARTELGLVSASANETIFLNKVQP